MMESPAVSRTDEVWSVGSLTRFIGRAREADRLAALLERHRLVTVVGAGGIGKTRLAAEVTARRIAAGAVSRTWLVELAAVTDPDDVVGAVAARLDCRQRAGRSTVASMAAVLAGESSCLVLDNCEHVIGAVAQLCSALLAENEDVRILATSREPIKLRGEARLRLEPLPAESSGPGDEEADAVRLFADRAEMMDSNFRLTSESVPLVRQLVARLDGLPLAIELAAARCESLGLTELVRRLDDPLSALTNGPASVPERHRSLRATMEWSYRLLSRAEQRALRCLAVVPGPFSLAVAEAVVGETAATVVPALVDWSLLAPPTVLRDGRPRYLMLETVRTFVRTLPAEESAERHAMSALVEYAVTTAEQASRDIRRSGREETAATWLDAEDALMREALSWSEKHDRAVALRLAVALSSWWQLRGRATSGYAVLRGLLSNRYERDDLWCRAQIWLGRLAHSTAQWSKALEHFGTVCDAAGAAPPDRNRVDALTGRSGTFRNLVRLPEASADAQTARESSRELKYVEGELQALVQLSLAADYADDQGAALEWAELAARVHSSEIPDRVSRRVAIALTMAQVDAGLFDGADAVCARGLELARRAGDVDMLADFLYLTAHIALQAGRFDQAAQPIHEALRLAVRSGDRLRVVGCIDDCALLCAKTGRSAAAVTLWTVYDLATDVSDLPHEVRRHADEIASAKKQLGARAARDAERRGAQLNIAAAIELTMVLLEADIDASAQSAPAELTPRERELLVHVAEGQTDAQIAEHLFISVRTVRSHLDRIRDKTGMRRRAELTRLAITTGLI